MNGDVSGRAEKAASYIDIRNELDTGMALNDEAVLTPDVDGATEEAIWTMNVEAFPLLMFIDERLASASENIYAKALEQVESHLFAKVLDITRGNQSNTAELLGITLGKVRDRITASGILLDRKNFHL